MTRADYFRAVILKSLKKRWSWLFGLPVLVLIGLLIVEQPLWVAVALAVVSHVLLAGYTAWGSYQRHKYEYTN
ncbi:hypothetical protein EHF33_03155 [Deinococcus psychrotolerans]|uniref:Uncharacterized protein n=1 Tax=Deinococcus psychrotolerans TaxID=2489213 RepID=A0A3G8YK55_9DEIO|nr:hypothetical protein [Deinococcus psychrotolerans]AZI41871.1 hypothetical protein EHF33_03155 [Deinococcus psychrotolerans]